MFLGNLFHFQINSMKTLFLPEWTRICFPIFITHQSCCSWCQKNSLFLFYVIVSQIYEELPSSQKHTLIVFERKEIIFFWKISVLWQTALSYLKNSIFIVWNIYFLFSLSLHIFKCFYISKFIMDQELTLFFKMLSLLILVILFLLLLICNKSKNWWSFDDRLWTIWIWQLLESL